MGSLSSSEAWEERPQSPWLCGVDEVMQQEQGGAEQEREREASEWLRGEEDRDVDENGEWVRVANDREVEWCNEEQKREEKREDDDDRWWEGIEGLELGTDAWYSHLTDRAEPGSEEYMYYVEELKEKMEECQAQGHEVKMEDLKDEDMEDF